MDVLTKEEFLERKISNIQKLKESIFIYPTDTIYGIGCNALDNDLVERLRVLKQRFDMPFSIIPPSIEWIEKNCVITDEAKKWINKLPGSYTLILKLKNKNVIAKEVNLGKDTIGIRIPDNWFTEIISLMNTPIITTSANISGQNFIKSIEELDNNLRKGVSMFINVGLIKGKPSTLVMLDKNKTINIKKR